jgi:hypothetical protein
MEVEKDARHGCAVSEEEQKEANEEIYIESGE